VLHDDQLHPYHYSRSAHLFLEHRPLFMQFLEWLRHERTADMTFCGQTKRVLSVAACSTSTSHLWAPDNSHAICECGYQISVWTVTARDIVVGPYLLPGRLTAQRYYCFLETVLPGLLAVRQCLRFQLDGASEYYGETRPTLVERDM
jgi:hypothetical protein